MTDMGRLTVEIHERDQSKINFALLWENTELITRDLFTFNYYQAQITKSLSTKKQPCSVNRIKYTKCLDMFYMENLGCFFPWLKSYNGNLLKCDGSRKVFELVNLIVNVTNYTTGIDNLKAYGCMENCETTSWIHTKSNSEKYEIANSSKLNAFFPATTQESII